MHINIHQIYQWSARLPSVGPECQHCLCSSTHRFTTAKMSWNWVVFKELVCVIRTVQTKHIPDKKSSKLHTHQFLCILMSALTYMCLDWLKKPAMSAMSSSLYNYKQPFSTYYEWCQFLSVKVLDYNVPDICSIIVSSSEAFYLHSFTNPFQPLYKSLTAFWRSLQSSVCESVLSRPQ